MNEEWVIRVFSVSGRSRVTVNSTCNLSTLKSKIASSLKVPEYQQLLSLDSFGNSLLKGDSLSIKQHGLYNGSIVYLITDATPQITATQIPRQMSTKDLPEITNKSETKRGFSEEDRKMSSSTSLSGNQMVKSDVPKFKSFDYFISERNYVTDDLPLKQSYRSTFIEKGKMNKIPPSVTLKHQPYRHVDHLEMMNLTEAMKFVDYWKSTLGMLKQRVGWMYGYYREDSSYPMGIRAVMEAIYEPPQEGSFGSDGSLILENDTFKPSVDAIANSLGLECLGLVFTHNERDELLTSQEIITLGKLQLSSLKTTHYTRYPVNTFVTCTIAPCKSIQGGDPVPNAFSVSDLGLAFLRDGIIDETKIGDKMHIPVRDGEKGELLPQILENGKSTKKFDAHWLVVRINESAPIQPKPFFSSTQFPRENRVVSQKPGDVSEFIKNRLASCPPTSYELLNDFHLLLYIAKIFDEATTISICNSIVNKVSIDQHLLEILMSLN
ncbi:nuclear pore associated (NLP4) with N-terminal ubiquitin domain [Cryptosporidium bovis]|uniref:nuclear pore associated (NLP4) with N-terminal ubiquitin domain n=1 Tax=Cryptosporidium bovis TaxID=310047 RepID=UPI00351A1FA4|nr:nuclear pore associated (NLP4) with N-terminal ubiquitin domain [Cryptosporidium bovis]